MSPPLPPSQSHSTPLRKTIALVAGIGICTLLITPFALAINRFDWGVGLLLVAPFYIWLLLWIAKALERWARNEPKSAPLDPDFPDDEEE